MTGILLVTLVILSSCDTSKLDPRPMDDFIGHWELRGPDMFKGMTIKIDKNEKGGLVGTVTRINDNKYVSMFLEPSDVWITKISRASNFAFKITEQKIGSALFSLYGLETTKEYNAEFIDQDTIGLSVENAKPTDSSIQYIRIE